MATLVANPPAAPHTRSKRIRKLTFSQADGLHWLLVGGHVLPKDQDSCRASCHADL
jgi:hypothetical protein